MPSRPNKGKPVSWHGDRALDAGSQNPADGPVFRHRNEDSQRAAGITFLSGTEDDPYPPEEPAEWRRYVDDRLHHFTISHR